MQGNAFKKGMTNFLPENILLNYIEDAARIGVRSMALIGEAEPLVNPSVYKAIVTGKKSGIDMSLGTNGILFDTGTSGEMALEHLEWVRFNISAATAEAYKKVHGSFDFEIAIKKIKFCVDLKRKKNLTTTIGLQMVLTPQDLDQAVLLAKLGADIGVDYLVIKQCSDDVDNSLGIYNQLENYNSENFINTLKEAEKCSNSSYQVIVKWKQITNEGLRNYDQCLGAPFLLYTTGDGRVYSCGDFFDKRAEEMLMGNLYEKSFYDIFNSDQYWKVIDKVLSKINCKKDCYSNCRTNNINEYLWQLKHPPAHKNFV
jgi:radical SAM protein with 4Fe4S-binding SPASM domain